MKRIIALLLAIVAIFTFTACSGDENTDASNYSGAASGGNESVSSASPSKESAYADAVAVLDAIWNSYADEDKFSSVGGNRDVMVENKPGSFNLSATEELTNSLLLPAGNIASIKSAASLIHMINANTFTSAVFQTDGNPDSLSRILVDAANAKQFICGAPQRIVTLKVDNYVIMAFGADDLIEAFKNYALAVEGVSLIHEGPITFTGGFGGVIPMG